MLVMAALMTSTLVLARFVRLAEASKYSAQTASPSRARSWPLNEGLFAETKVKDSAPDPRANCFSEDEERPIGFCVTKNFDAGLSPASQSESNLTVTRSGIV